MWQILRLDGKQIQLRSVFRFSLSTEDPLEKMMALLQIIGLFWVVTALAFGVIDNLSPDNEVNQFFRIMVVIVIPLFAGICTLMQTPRNR